MTISRFIQSILALGIAILFVSCDPATTETGYIDVPQKDAQVYAFSISTVHDKSIEDSVLRSEDSIRMIILGKTKFAIDNIGNTIYNPEPLPYGTNIKKLKVTLTTKSAHSIKFVNADTTVVWNTTDSVDFSTRPISVIVTAIDTTSTKEYQINLRVYTHDQDSIRWQQMRELPNSTVNQQNTILDVSTATFYHFSANGNSIVVNSSNKSTLSWNTTPTTGLPANIDLKSITLINNAFYAISTDGKTWTSTNSIAWGEFANTTFVSAIYGVLPTTTSADDYLLVAIDEGGVKYFAKMKDGAIVEKLRQIDADFPIKDFAATTNYNRTGSNNMLIVTAGTTTLSEASNKTWVIENKDTGIAYNAFYKNDYFSGSSLGVALYNNSLYTLSGKKFYIGKSWGSSWINAMAKQNLPAEANNTISQQQVITDNEGYIWVFGGKTQGGTYSTQVWRGRLNSLDPSLKVFSE